MKRGITTQTIIDHWARLPNKGERKILRAYETAGIISQADNYHLVIGGEREVIKCPLYGNPQTTR